MSIWIPCVQAYLHAGDFVLASPQEGAVPLVGRIMGGSTVNGIQVTWWLSRNELLQIAGIEAVPLLSAQTHRNVQLCKIVEVTERVLSISEISFASLPGRFNSGIWRLDRRISHHCYRRFLA